MRMGFGNTGGFDEGEYSIGPAQAPRTSGMDVHPVLGAVRFRVRELGGDPDGQVRKTVGIMRDRVLEDVQEPRFRWWVESRLPYWPGATDAEKVDAAYGLVQNSIKFQRDEMTGEGLGGWGSPDVVETIVRPLDMVQYIDSGVAIGDCDDYSMLTSACLTVLGIPNGFCTVAADDRDPNQYSHVYVVAFPLNEYGKRERLALDTSHGDYPGWEVPNKFGKRTEWMVKDMPFSCNVGSMTLLAGALYAGYWIMKGLRVL
jgi:hypothetical protein